MIRNLFCAPIAILLLAGVPLVQSAQLPSGDATLAYWYALNELSPKIHDFQRNLSPPDGRNRLELVENVIAYVDKVAAHYEGLSNSAANIPTENVDPLMFEAVEHLSAAVDLFDQTRSVKEDFDEMLALERSWGYDPKKTPADTVPTPPTPEAQAKWSAIEKRFNSRWQKFEDAMFHYLPSAMAKWSSASHVLQAKYGLPFFPDIEHRLAFGLDTVNHPTDPAFDAASVVRLYFEAVTRCDKSQFRSHLYPLVVPQLASSFAAQTRHFGVLESACGVTISPPPVFRVHGCGTSRDERLHYCRVLMTEVQDGTDGIEYFVVQPLSASTAYVVDFQDRD